MKKPSRLLIILLVFAMSLTIASCKRKATERIIDADEFTKIMEDKFDCEVNEFEKDDNMEEYLIAKSEDGSGGYRIEYIIYEEEDPAEEHYEAMLESLENGIEDEDVEGEVKETGSGKYKKLVFEGESHGFDLYIALVQFDEMIIRVSSQETSKSNIKEINKAIKALGY